MAESFQQCDQDRRRWQERAEIAESHLTAAQDEGHAWRLRAEEAEQRAEDADLRRIEAESRDQGHAAARMRLYNEAKQAEAERASEERWANQYKAQRDAARKQRDLFANQIAALSSTIRRRFNFAIYRDDPEPVCPECLHGNGGHADDCEVGKVLSDTAAAAEAHDAAIRRAALEEVIDICRARVIVYDGQAKASPRGRKDNLTRAIEASFIGELCEKLADKEDE